MFRRTFVVTAATVLLLAVAAGVGARWSLVPVANPRPLPERLIAADSAPGRALLAGAEAAADYPALTSHFQAQILRSYCGVASSVIALRALGRPASQQGFFTDPASQVRSRLAVTFGGMTLDELGGLLEAHGLDVAIHHADGFSSADLRRAVVSNLGRPGDLLLVNYQREALGQPRMGHISPLAAYDADTDRVLVLDTAAYHYPWTWVPLEALHRAMAGVDPGSGRSRGYVTLAPSSR